VAAGRILTAEYGCRQYPAAEFFAYALFAHKKKRMGQASLPEHGPKFCLLRFVTGDYIPV
jgi:hypothetical protein